ncbi:MAG TPA: D-aminoacylase, partial [Acidilobales archaeon]|nr:D-aminoacylase [Acidilobales archaeon]
MEVVEYDLIIRGGIIVDGTGAPPFKADIGIRNGLIVKIGDLSTSKADVLIDAKTLYVTPGFIDIHNHSDLSIFNVPTADNYVLQGVTTLVIGNCGASPAPISDVNRELIKELVWGVGDIDVNISWETFSEYLDRLNDLRKSVNIAALVGHGALRSAVLGFDSVVANERDIKSMKELLIDALNSGAFGMSLGLIYVPSMYADRRELLELSKILAKYNALLAVHMRDEALNLLDSVFEILSLAIESGVKVEISHLKAVG